MKERSDYQQSVVDFTELESKLINLKHKKINIFNATSFVRGIIPVVLEFCRLVIVNFKSIQLQNRTTVDLLKIIKQQQQQISIMGEEICNLKERQ